MLFAVWCFHHSTFSAQRYDNFQERQKHTLINLLFWREWNLPLAKFLSVENNKALKDLRTVWMIGYQVKTYYLCCSLFLLFRQSFISVAGCRFKPSRWIGKGFGAVYSPTEEESSCKWEQSQVYLSYAECSRVSVNCSKLRLTFSYSKRGLATFASDKRDKRHVKWTSSRIFVSIYEKVEQKDILLLPNTIPT